MLHAPTSKPKERNETRRDSVMEEVKREFHPRYPDTSVRDFADSSTGSPAAQRNSYFAGLQQTVGNQAVLRMLAHSTPATAHLAGTRLTVNQHEDPYEREANRMAERITRMPALLSGPTFSGMNGEKHLQRKSTNGEGPFHPAEMGKNLRGAVKGPAGLSYAPPVVGDVLRSPGQPLAPAARAFMEPRFGRDFSGVRIHADARAAQSAADLGARAYTHNSNIVFGAGEYKPGTQEGNCLLTHELTHVVQQANPQKGSTLPSIQRFTTAEHFDIGNAAYEMAAFDFSSPAFKQSFLYQTLRDGSRFLPTGNRVKAYGDIVADGDFFQAFEDLIRENGERPGRAGMAALATRNIHHFTPTNIREWIPQHDFAVEQMLFAYQQLKFVKDWRDSIDPLLEGARAAILRDDYARAERLMNEYRRLFEPSSAHMIQIARSAHLLAQQALARNAFAEHFLTDAFSAGHIVTPRQEILQEAGVRLDQRPTTFGLVRSALASTWTELGEVRAQARSLAWHDLDNYCGVEVRDNISGSAPWIACGDGCSTRTGDTHWPATRASVIRATTESIKDMWRAGLTGVRPPNYRSTLDLVPRPTFQHYPVWGAREWENQLRYIRGDNAQHAPGETLDILGFGVDLHPIEHCRQLDIGCYDPFVLTQQDWIRQYSFDRWVRPWISRIQATAADRYRF